MEKEGLHRALESLKQCGVSVGVMVTDRNRQTNKWIRESHLEVKHLCLARC